MEVPRISLGGWDKQLLIPPDELLLAKHPRERRRLAALLRVGAQMVSKRIMGKRKYWQRLEAKAEQLTESKAMFAKGWSDYMQEALKTHTAMELLAQLRPKHVKKGQSTAGAKPKAKAKAKAKMAKAKAKAP